MKRDSWKLKKDFRLLTGMIIFILLIFSAYIIHWILGTAFLIGFLYSIYSKTLDRKPFLPLILFIFVLALRICIIIFYPEIFKSEILVDLIIAFAIFLIILIVHFKKKRNNF